MEAEQQVLFAVFPIVAALQYRLGLGAVRVPGLKLVVVLGAHQIGHDTKQGVLYPIRPRWAHPCWDNVKSVWPAQMTIANTFSELNWVRYHSRPLFLMHGGLLN